jgi:hypothetical protein
MSWILLFSKPRFFTGFGLLELLGAALSRQWFHVFASQSAVRTTVPQVD